MQNERTGISDGFLYILDSESTIWSAHVPANQSVTLNFIYILTALWEPTRLRLEHTQMMIVVVDVEKVASIRCRYFSTYRPTINNERIPLGNLLSSQNSWTYELVSFVSLYGVNQSTSAHRSVGQLRTQYDERNVLHLSQLYRHTTYHWT